MTDLTILVEGLCSTDVEVNITELSQHKENFLKPFFITRRVFYSLFRNRVFGFFPRGKLTKGNYLVAKP